METKNTIFAHLISADDAAQEVLETVKMNIETDASTSTEFSDQLVTYL